MRKLKTTAYLVATIFVTGVTGNIASCTLEQAYDDRMYLRPGEARYNIEREYLDRYACANGSLIASSRGSRLYDIRCAF